MIREYLSKILSARYGRDVRQAIHDSIQQCYYDGKAGEIDLQARQDIETLNGEVESLKDADIAINENIQALENAMNESLQALGNTMNESVQALGNTMNESVQALGSDVADLKEADNTINQTLQELGDDVSDLKVSAKDIVETTETTMPNTCEGRLLFKEIKEKTEQGANPSPTNPQEIKSVAISGIKTHGKNLLENTATSQTINGVTFTVHKNGTVTVNGTAIATAGITINIGTYPSGNYVFSGCPSGGSYGETYYMLWSGPNWSPQARDSGNGANLTLDKETNMTAFINVFEGTTVNNLVFKPMIRKADIEDATYEPYCGSSFTFSPPIELNKIGDVQDVIDFENGKIIRRIKTLHGTSGWVKTNVESSTKGYRYYIAVPDRAVLNNCEVICSHYTHMVGSSYWDEGDYISTNEANSIIIRSTNISTLDEFNTALADMKICYPLATPVEEALPIAMNSIKTCDGTTYLEIDSPLQPEFVAEYGTSKVGGKTLEALAIARNNEIRISALETSAVNNI